jgi:BirA family biotin operon repressor/biotin-[acetyl-CoA-carboxylase] ligase
LRRDTVASTQDLALAELSDLPVVVLSAAQTAGRGRLGAGWINAPRALAVSLAFDLGADDTRPLSLMAGVAATRVVPGSKLKWPNDVLMGHAKAGGILVEISEGRAAIGFGLNLWWPDAPEGMAGVFEQEPDPELHLEVGASWAAELMAIVDSASWPADEYRARCSTLGRQIAWEPGGAGRAVDVDALGRLLVEVGDETLELSSGAVRHVSVN